MDASRATNVPSKQPSGFYGRPTCGQQTARCQAAQKRIFPIFLMQWAGQSSTPAWTTCSIIWLVLQAAPSGSRCLPSCCKAASGMSSYLNKTYCHTMRKRRQYRPAHASKPHWMNCGDCARIQSRTKSQASLKRFNWEVFRQRKLIG